MRSTQTNLRRLHASQRHLRAVNTWGGSIPVLQAAMIGVKNEPDTARSRPFQWEARPNCNGPGVTSSMPIRPISIRWSRATRPARAIASCPKFWSTGRGKSIVDVYEMSVTDAAAFTDPAIARILKRLDDVELGLLAQGLAGPAAGRRVRAEGADITFGPLPGAISSRPRQL